MCHIYTKNYKMKWGWGWGGSNEYQKKNIGENVEKEVNPLAQIECENDQ